MSSLWKLARWAALQLEFALPQMVHKCCWGLHHPRAAGDISPVLREPHTPLQASQPKQGVFIREIFLA